MSITAPARHRGLETPDPGTAGTAWSDRARAWLSAHAVSIVLLVTALAAIGFVHATGMTDYPFRHDDEGTYVAQAWAYQDNFRLSHYTYWYDHPPTGWITLAGYLVATGAFERYEHAVHGGREAMLLIHLVTSALLYVLCRRLGFARGWALLALALFSFSPLALTYHRWVFLDNLAMPWLLASFVLALTPGKRLSAYAGSGLCFALAVLTKETMLLALPALLYQVWQNTDDANRRYAWTVFGSLLVLTGLLFPLYALLRGELLPGPDHVSLFDAIRFHLADRDAEDPLSVVRNWLTRDQLLLMLGGLAAVPAAFQRRLRPYVALVAVHVAVALRPGGYLPEPYVIAFFAPAALLIAGAFDALWNWRLSTGRHVVPGRLLRVAEYAPRGLVSVAAVALAVVLVPAWAPGVMAAMEGDEDAPARQAREWVRQHVDTDERLLVENTMWVDFVHDGFPEGNVIWFSKLGLDPAVEEDLPDGWQEFDYVVGTSLIPTMTQVLAVEELRLVLENSDVVAEWGEGANVRVEVRRVRTETAGTNRPINADSLRR